MSTFKERLANLTSKQKIGIAACLTGLLFVGLGSCAASVWYVTSQAASRKEQERLAKEVKAGAKSTGDDRAPKKKLLSFVPGKAADVEGMKFELLEGKFGKARCIDVIAETEFDTEENLLQVKFQVSNGTKDSVWHYDQFDDFRLTPVLKDELGNEYKHHRLMGGQQVKGGLGRSTADIYPGHTMIDVVLFEAANLQADSFTLEVPSEFLRPNTGWIMAYKIPRAWFK